MMKERRLTRVVQQKRRSDDNERIFGCYGRGGLHVLVAVDRVRA